MLLLLLLGLGLDALALLVNFILFKGKRRKGILSNLNNVEETSAASDDDAGEGQNSELVHRVFDPQEKDRRKAKNKNVCSIGQTVAIVDHVVALSLRVA
jgi:hypothetical protein